MKLVTTTWVSVDGVMQGLGDVEEDRRDQFDRGGWAMPYSDPEVESALNAVYEAADAFLFGRWTYELFRDSWGTIPEMKDSVVGRALNATRKYVASTTLQDPQWDNTTVIAGDLATEVSDLKATTGGILLLPGSRKTNQWLMAQGMVDEINLFIAPVVIGDGAHLFPASGPDRALELAESRITANGVTIATYRVAGQPQYGVTETTTTAWS